MVMSDKTVIVQLKKMNTGGLRGGHFGHANVENDMHLLGFGLEML